MGSYRSEPQLTKHTYEMFSLDHSYAVSHMCGWRKYMEDASMIISPFTYRNYSLFGIFDGHGGPQVALFAQKHFPQLLQHNQHFKTGKFQQALKQTFLNLDRLIMSLQGVKQLIEIRKNQVLKHNSSEDGSITRIGSTCLVVLVTKQSIFIANAGDCRALVGTYSGTWKQATKDHKPYDYEEQARILRAGGIVQNGRVNGVLNLSRALGDLQFKDNTSFRLEQQLITSLPDVFKVQREDLHFIFLCCDGVWQCKSNQLMTQFLRKNLRQQRNLGKILEHLFEQSVAKQCKQDSGTDNMSAILIKFDKHMTLHDKKL